MTSAAVTLVMAKVMASVMLAKVSSETALAGFGDGVGDVGNGVVRDGVGDVGDGVVGDGVGDVGVGIISGAFRW